MRSGLNMSDTENIDCIWTGDLLGRAKDAAFLEAYLERTSQQARQTLERDSLVVNFKGEWGSGKTFFLDRFARQLKASGHLVVTVNAWKLDPELDPLVSLIGEMQAQINGQLSFSDTVKKSVADAFGNTISAAGPLAKRVGQAVLWHLGKKAFGEATEDILEEIASTLKDADISKFAAQPLFERQVADSQKQKAAIEEFVESLGALVKILEAQKGHKVPIYIFIDELDRCRPTFAINVLERINHLFDTTGLVFLIGTDSDELAHSIKAVYGAEFNADRYLQRFFNFTYHLPAPQGDDYLNQLFEEFDIDFAKFIVPRNNDSKDIMRKILKAGADNPRSQRQIVFMLRTLQDVVTESKTIDLIYAAVCAVFIYRNDANIIAMIHGNQNTNNLKTLDKVYANMRHVSIRYTSNDDLSKSANIKSIYVKYYAQKLFDSFPYGRSAYLKNQEEKDLFRNISEIFTQGKVVKRFWLPNTPIF